jgi:hypothetical protein
MLRPQAAILKRQNRKYVFITALSVREREKVARNSERLHLGGREKKKCVRSSFW